MSFVGLAKIEFSVDGVISTLGVSTAPYFGDAAGLVNNTWYPILQTDISVEISAVLPWESGNPEDSFGTLRLVNGADGLNDHVLDRFINAQVSGLDTEIKRGDSGETFDEMEPWFLSKSDRLWFQGRTLLISQRSRLDILSKPLITQVFDETTPNPRLVNQSVPLLIGPAFQINPPIFDAQNQIFYVASNASNIPVVRQGGARTSNFEEVDFGFQVIAGSLDNPLPFTADAIGPAPDAQSETIVVDWTFDSWTSDDPDDIDVTESTSGSPLEAEISQDGSNDVADITVRATPTADTGWLTLQNPIEPTFVGLATNDNFWTPSGSSSIEESVVADDGEFAEAVFYDFISLRVGTFEPSLPDGNEVTGVEIELIAEGSNAEITILTANQREPGTRVAAYVDRNGEVQNSGITASAITGTKSTITGGGTNFVGAGVGVREDVDSDDVNEPGMHFTIQLKPATAGEATVKIHRVRIKVHHRPSIDLVRLFTPSSALEPGERHTVTIETTAADIFARWGGSDSSGGDLVDSTDPFSTSSSSLEGPNRFSFEFVPADEEFFFGIEFKRLNLAGTASINRITVEKRADGKNKFKSLVPYMAGLLTDDDLIDQTTIDAHDEATGSPEIGTYITANESFSEVMSFFVRSLSGTWWRDRDAKVRSALWVFDSDATPVLSLDAFTLDGILRQPKIAEGGEVRTAEAPNATERAVGAKNQDPLRVGETAGITEEFSLQELANVIEEWRVRRRANFDDLNPWPVAQPTLSLTSISPKTGDPAGGTTVTITGENFDTDSGVTTDVTFGGTSGTNIVVNSSTEIQADTPSGTVDTTVDVTITQGGESDTLTDAFEYTSSAWSPGDITTDLWVEADSASPFEDMSGNANHFVASSGRSLPTISSAALNGRDIFTFDGSSQRMEAPVGVDIRDAHVFIVGKTRSSDEFLAGMRNASDNTRWYITSFTSSSQNFRWGAASTTADPGTSWHVFESIADGNSKEGLFTANSKVTATDSNVFTHSKLIVGGADNPNEALGEVDIYAIVKVPTSTPAADIERVQGYLAHRAGLEGDLPSGHPYKSSPP